MVTLAVLVFGSSDLFLSPAAIQALNIRLLFLETTIDMVASRPLFGVGVGGYYLWSAQFSPPELLEIYYRENAHNYFLQIAGELGLVGFAAFVWLLCTAVWSAWPGARLIRRDPLGFGLFAGVTAFLLTCLSGHPLLIPEVIYPFWMALGLAVGAASTQLGSSSLADPPDLARKVDHSRQQTVRATPSAHRRWVVASMVVFLFLSIPSRVAREMREVDLTRVAYGFHEWEENEAGVRFRWTTRRARFHVTGEARWVDMPLRGRVEDPGHPLDVDIFVDGQPVLRVQLIDDSWQRARVPIPPEEEPQFRRIELRVGSTFVPRDSLPGSTDSRELGVQVGEVTVAAER